MVVVLGWRSLVPLRAGSPMGASRVTVLEAVSEFISGDTLTAAEGSAVLLRQQHAKPDAFIARDLLAGAGWKLDRRSGCWRWTDGTEVRVDTGLRGGQGRHRPP